jgi:flavin reductase (DIM6/NTAB) family NADH-FMN oxidoreductase RutF
MKNLLTHLLSGGIPITEYATVTVPIDIYEKVVFEIDHQIIDISSQQWLLSLDPVVFGIWLPKEKLISIPGDHASYRIRFMDTSSNNKTTADLKLEYFTKIEEPEGILAILKLTEVSVYHINFIKTRVLFYRHYKKPAHTFKKLKSFAAAYSYPRKVRLISFGNQADSNIFPMDLVGEIPSIKGYVFGLRHTNTSLQGIIESGKIVVSEVPYQYKNLIYQLGKHHQNSMTESALPFDVIRSALFGFPVPAWSNSYKELKIKKTINLGSHMLLWAEVLHEEMLSIPEGHLFHVHFLHYLHQVKTGDPYPLVS